jgi:hypothetical protein
MRVAPVIRGFALGVSALAGDGDRVPLGDVAERAVQQSKLTLPGSKPFHLEGRDCRDDKSQLRISSEG